MSKTPPSEAWLLHQAFRRSVAACPEKLALIAGQERFTYRMLGDMTDGLAATLQARGVRRGDRVTIFTDNGPATVVSIFAALQAGAVFSPVNPLTKMEKLSYLLNDCRPVCLVASASLQETFLPALSDNRSVRTCIVADGPVPPTSGEVEFLAFADLVSSGASVVESPSGSASPAALTDPGTVDQDLAAIIYTSGSTGEPKGVMLTHLNMVTAARSVIEYLGLRPEDVILCALPLAFGYGLYQLFLGFQVGATVVLERSFTFPVEILNTMERERVTVLPGVPTMFSTLLGLKTLRQHDLRSLRMITNAAAALSESHIRDLRGLFPDAVLFSMYGLTECTRVTYLPPEELDRRPTSVGRGMPNQEVFLVDEAGRRLPLGSTGELVVRGSHVMRGYWEKPEETAQRLKPGLLPGETLLYSGDVFRTDAEGYLYFVGRKDDIIKTRGEKVSPREVENVLYGIEGVLEAAVIGVPDDLLGRAIKAFLVLEPGYRYTERDIIRYCLAHLENHMAPKYVSFAAELPKTETGKIKKTVLA